MSTKENSLRDNIKSGFVDGYFKLSKKMDWAMSIRGIKRQLKGLPELTEKQKREIRDFWSEHLGEKGGVDIPLEWHRFFYGKLGIEAPGFVPPPVYEYYIRPNLNPPNFAIAIQNKGYLERLIPDVPTVRSVVRNTNGRFLNENFELIPFKEARRIISQYEKLVVKPSLFSNHGDSVRLLTAPFDLHKIDHEYRNNYVLQIPLKQHEEMAALNPSSTNAVRVVTFLLDDKPHVACAYIRVGAKGEFADNAGNDRFLIGIRENGKMADYAIDRQDRIHKSIPSGVDFAGKDMPGYEDMVRCAEKAHENLSFFGLVAFDICINEEGKAVIIEANLKQPAINKQLCTGPYFGKYTAEVLEYCKTHNATKEVGWPRMW